MESIRRFFVNLRSEESRVEAKALFHLAWPVSLICVFEMAIQSLALVYCGHLEEYVFAGVCLAVSFTECTAVALGNGFGTAIDTLVPQTFGANNMRRVGIVIQMSVLIFSALCFPVWGIWLNTGYITSFIAEDPRAARVAGEFVEIFVPALPAIYLFIIISKYMENLEIVKPLLITGAFSTTMSAIYYGILIYGCGLGYKGAAIASAMGNYTLTLSTLALIWWKGLHRETWGGWTKECLLHWGLFYKLAIPGFFMICMEWWIFQAGTIILSVLGDTVLNAQGIMFQIVALISMIPYAISVAVCTRVGIFLGGGKPEKAKFVANLSVFLTCVCVVVVSVVFLACSHVVGYIFTSDVQVIKVLSTVCLLYFAITVYFDWLQLMLQGIFRGCGYQYMGAMINNITYILIAVPVGVVLALKTSLGIIGYWLGILCGVSFQFFAYLTVVYKTDWKKQSFLAKDRADARQQEESAHLLEEDEYSKGALHLSHSGGYGAVDVEIIDKNQLNDRTIQHIPSKTIISRLLIFLFSFGLFLAGLLCRIYYHL